MDELPINMFPVIFFPAEDVIITVHTVHFTGAGVNLCQFSRDYIAIKTWSGGIYYTQQGEEEEEERERSAL